MLRGVRSPTRTRVQDIAAYVADLQQEGHRLVMLTANLPASVLMGQLEALDVETKDIVFIDAISSQDIAHEPAHRAQVMYLSGPCALEAMAQRVRKVAQFLEHEHPDEPHPHIALCSFNALALYNDRGMLEQFLHRLRNQWGHRPVVMDILVDDGPGSEGWVREMVERYAESMADLAPHQHPERPVRPARPGIQAAPLQGR